MKNMDYINIDSNNIELFHENYVRKRIPVILKNAAKEWPLINSWTNNYLIKLCENIEFKVVQDSRSGENNSLNFSSSLEKYLEEEKGFAAYIHDSTTHSLFSDLFGDLDPKNPFFRANEIEKFLFFFAKTNAGALPHVHVFDVFNVLQKGKKQWVFFDASEHLAPLGYKTLQEYHKSYGRGSTSLQWFERELSSLENKVESSYTGIQEAGDLVYIPIEYSHAVLNLEDCVGLVLETKV